MLKGLEEEEGGREDREVEGGEEVRGWELEGGGVEGC